MTDTTRRTDYRTYPGDRPTRHTPAQRAKKVRTARMLLGDALNMLDEVCDDFAANGYRLPESLVDEWRELARMADATRKAIES